MSVPMSKAVVKDTLKSVPLFAELTDPELELLASTSRSLPMKKGARVFEEGAPADCCYVLTSGRAKLVLSAEGGTEIILSLLHPKELTGEVALLDGSARSADLISTEDCQFIRIPKSSFDALRRNFAFEVRIVAHALSLLRSANDQVRGTASLPSLSKVAWCLARLARREGRRQGALVVISKPPHHELAEMAGCARETVTRALGVLKRKKGITWDDDTMAIDVEALQRVLRQNFPLDGRTL